PYAARRIHRVLNAPVPHNNKNIRRNLMGILRELYDWSERTIWNSLSKKLASFFLLYAINLGYLYVYLEQKRYITAALASNEVSPELAANINASLDGGLTAVIIL